MWNFTSVCKTRRLESQTRILDLLRWKVYFTDDRFLESWFSWFVNSSGQHAKATPRQAGYWSEGGNPLLAVPSLGRPHSHPGAPGVTLYLDPSTMSRPNITIFYRSCFFAQWSTKAHLDTSTTLFFCCSCFGWIISIIATTTTTTAIIPTSLERCSANGELATTTSTYTLVLLYVTVTQSSV